MAYFHDARGNVKQTLRVQGTADAITTSVVYDPKYSLPISMTDPLGRVMKMTYNTLGQLVLTQNRLGQTSLIAYNTAGVSVQMSNNLGERQIMTYTAANDLIQMSDPLGRTSRVFVDAAGRMPVGEDALGQGTRTLYSSFSQVLTTTACSRKRRSMPTTRTATCSA